MSGRPWMTVFGPACLVGALGALSGSCAEATLPDGEGDGEGVPSIPTDENGSSSTLEIGAQARVTADFLNMRSGPGTSNDVLVEMPCGGWVKVLDGPSTGATTGWWNVTYSGPEARKYTGWASGKYLIAASAFDKSTCGAPVQLADMADPTPPDFAGVDLLGVDLSHKPADLAQPPVIVPPNATDAIFDRAKLAVGYSYWWGHGAWRTDGASRGTCTGSCPSCSHTDSYGADCSGFVAKAWQVPSTSALSVDAHPYSTYNFYNEETYWQQISRDTVKPADAMVRRVGSAGHIVLIESASDPYGALWLYEARGCATGVVHNARTIDSSYRTIRKDGL